MKGLRYFAAGIVFIFCFSSIFAAEPESTEKEKFNTVDYIFEHVNDSHEWYFLSVGKNHIAIPLPVILYSKESGWHFFFSSKLIHQPEGFPFQIAKEGNNKDKIIELLKDGSEYVPLDLSLTKTVLGMIIIALLLVVLLLKATKNTVKNPMRPPSGLQNLIEPVVLFIRDDVAKPFAGEKYARYLPFLLTIFFFILASNLLGLVIPLGINITGNIAVTMVLAIFTFVITTVSGNKHYWAEIFNPPEVPWFMKLPIPIIPLVEFMGIFTKPIILCIRLFANMFAGHMVVAVLLALIFLMSIVFNPYIGAVTSVVSVLFSVFIVIVDILVAFIQAYIFTVLSAMYIGNATEVAKH